MADLGHRHTDKVLSKMETEIRNAYLQATAETQKKLDDYLSAFKTKDQIKRKQLKEGKITDQEYNYWRTGQICIGKRWQEIVDTLSEDYTNADRIAASIVNGYMPEVYALNHNYTAYTMEKQTGLDLSFTLYDRRTVENLLKNKPDLLPKSTVDIPLDKQWNKKHIVNAITQGILQGESIPNLSKRLQNVSDMDTRAAIRNARTATTGAENAGRLDSYKHAGSMGIDLMQEWMATLDGRTRYSHRQLDGERIKVGDKWHHYKFSNGCRYPGDPQGPPHEVWNCRCTLVAAIKGIDQSDAPRNSKLGSMTYEEWKRMKRKNEVQKAVEKAKETKSVMPVVPSKKNEYIKDIMASSTTSQLTAEQKVEFESILNKMSEEHLELYKEMTRFHADNDYIKGRGFYSRVDRRVEMNINNAHWEKSVGRKSSTGAWKTKFHEELHQLDSLVGITKTGNRYQMNSACVGDWWSNPTLMGTRLGTAIEKDLVQFFNTSVDKYSNTYTQAKHIKNLNILTNHTKLCAWSYLDELTTEEYSKKCAMLSPFTDALGLATKSRMNAYNKGYWGHDAKYQKEQGMNGATSELFAEIGAFIMTNDTETLSVVEQVMPNTVAEYKSVLHEIVEYVRTNPLHY